MSGSLERKLSSSITPPSDNIPPEKVQRKFKRTSLNSILINSFETWRESDKVVWASWWGNSLSCNLCIFVCWRCFYLGTRNATNSLLSQILWLATAVRISLSILDSMRITVLILYSENSVTAIVNFHIMTWKPDESWSPETVNCRELSSVWTVGFGSTNHNHIIYPDLW